MTVVPGTARSAARQLQRVARPGAAAAPLPHQQPHSPSPRSAAASGAGPSRCRAATWARAPSAARPAGSSARRRRCGGGGADIRLRPHRARRLEHAARVDRRHQAVRHQRRRVRVGEVGAAGPVGQHHRAAQQHALRRHQAEALAAVQRQHDVGAGRQRVVVRQRQGAGLEPDVAGAGRRSPQPLQVGGEMPGMADLHHQDAVRPRRRTPPGAPRSPPAGSCARTTRPG